jgi:ABC-type maltose transport system permease subunit
MRDELVTLTIVVFGILLVANIFFRIKTFRTFKKLAELGVSFSKEHMLNKEKLYTEVVAQFPQHEKLILQHLNSMKLSLRISTMCIFVLTVCGAVLMYYR